MTEVVDKKDFLNEIVSYMLEGDFTLEEAIAQTHKTYESCFNEDTSHITVRAMDIRYIELKIQEFKERYL